MYQARFPNVDAQQAERRERAAWHGAISHAIPISLFVLLLLYYWFAAANRYIIFLYDHLGAQPFDRVTSSRYWMAGLVAAGMVMVLYTVTAWALARVRGPSFQVPLWNHVWALAAPPLIIGIPIITMSLNQPVLTPGLAAACTAAALIGLALALVPAGWAAARPAELVWLGADGLALVPVLLTMPALGLGGKTLNLPFGEVPIGWLVVISLVGGIFWLAVMTAMRRIAGMPMPGLFPVLLASFALHYLLLPVMHHFYRWKTLYISASDNFFARSVWLQLATWLVALLMAAGAFLTRRRYQSAPQG